MNDWQANSTLISRLVSIALSSAFVVIPQVLWTQFGYQGALLVAIESVFVLLAFVTLLSGLMDPVPGPISFIGNKIWSFVESAKEKRGIITKAAPLGILAYSIYLLVPIFLSSLKSYTGFSAATIVLLAVITAALLCIITAINFLERRDHISRPSWYYLPIATLAIAWAFAFWYGSPAYPTDEMLIDFYSAHLALNGMNPYLAANTIGVFSFFHSTAPGYPLNIGTPILTGGIVTSLGYPAMSIFSYVPALLLNFSPTESFLPLYALPAVLIFYAYSGEKNRLLSLFPVFILLLDPSYLIQASLGYPDIVWMILFMVSLYFYRKPLVSGIGMGLAMAVKQIPWVAFPFMLIMIYRETGRKSAFIWTAVALASFVLPNLPFIIGNPAGYFQAIISPETVQLMGVGFGPSQLGFLGIVQLQRTFFTILMISSALSFVILYFFYYDKLKYAFLAFPIVIFLFNYRFLMNYAVFWPLIALIIPEMMKEGENKPLTRNPAPFHLRAKKKTIALILAVLMIGVPLAFHEVHGTTQSMGLGNIQVVSANSKNITELQVSLDLYNPSLTYGKVLYRIVPWSSAPNLNGYLWHYLNISAGTHGANITIVPDNALQQIPHTGRYRLIAYYGGFSSSVTFKALGGSTS